MIGIAATDGNFRYRQARFQHCHRRFDAHFLDVLRRCDVENLFEITLDLGGRKARNGFQVFHLDALVEMAGDVFFKQRDFFIQLGTVAVIDRKSVV